MTYFPRSWKINIFCCPKRLAQPIYRLKSAAVETRQFHFVQDIPGESRMGPRKSRILETPQKERNTGAPWYSCLMCRSLHGSRRQRPIQPAAPDDGPLGHRGPVGCVPAGRGVSHPGPGLRRQQARHDRPAAGPRALLQGLLRQGRVPVQQPAPHRTRERPLPTHGLRRLVTNSACHSLRNLVTLCAYHNLRRFVIFCSYHSLRRVVTICAYHGLRRFVTISAHPRGLRRFVTIGANHHL